MNFSWESFYQHLAQIRFYKHGERSNNNNNHNDDDDYNNNVYITVYPCDGSSPANTKQTAS